MRVTNNHLYNQSLQSLNKANERNLSVTEKLSAQTNIVRPSDDPSGAAQVMRYESSNRLLEQYEENMTYARNALEYEEVALDSFETMLTNANVLFIQAENSALSQEDVDAIVSELALMMESAVDLMNSQDAAGNYIFAGASNESPAFQKDSSGRYAFVGDEVQRNVQIADSVTVASNDSGKSVFQDTWSRHTFTATSGASFSSKVADQDAYDDFIMSNYDAITPANNTYTLTTDGADPNQYSLTDANGNVVASGSAAAGADVNVLGMSFSIDNNAAASISVTLDTPTRDNVVNQITDALAVLSDPTTTQAEREEAFRNATVSISNAQESVGLARSAVGVRLNTLSDRESFSADKSISNTTAQESIAGLDVAKAAAELALSEAAITASQTVFTRLSSLSLFNSL